MSKAILLVDDDEALRETLAEVLEDEGHAVECATDGADAMAKLRGGLRPDVILLDLMMPVMNGWQFREAQLADAELASMPVIVITAGRPERAIDARKILKKPFDVEELLLAIATV
ncbi:MAG TPA: response regulator [Anaeromyxobacteraceae bacterium]|nr:response regulator [Anaeromyxobacteraceae bacterium]